MEKHNYFTKWWFHLNSYNVICLGMYDKKKKKKDLRFSTKPNC